MKKEKSWSSVVGTALTITLGSAATFIVLTSFPGVGQMIGLPTVSTTLATSDETNSLVKKFSHSIESAAPKKVGALISARLNNFSALPNARISVVQGKEPSVPGARMQSSFALPAPGSKVCPVVVVVDLTGQATLVRELPKILGFDPGVELSSRLTDFEILHELGHCKAQQNDVEFNHPALSKEQNALLSSAIKGTEAGSMWDESYADMFAALNQIETAKSNPKKSAQAQSDIEIILEWRKMSRLKYTKVEPGLGEHKLVVENGAHITEVSLQALLSESRWAHSKEPIETRAAQLASIGLVRTLGVTVNPKETAENFILPKNKLAKALVMVFASIRHDVTNAKELKESRTDFIAREGVDLANGFNQGGEVLKALGLRAKELSAVAWDVETKEANARKILAREPAASMKEIDANFTEKFSNYLNKSGLLDEISSDPKIQQAKRETIQAWNQVAGYEAQYSYVVEDPRSEALVKIALSEQDGEGRVVKGFYNNVPVPATLSGRLNEWRSSRKDDPVSTSTLPPARPI